MSRRTDIIIIVAATVFGSMGIATPAQGATVQAGVVLAQHVDYRARMEREAAGYVRAGHRALRRGQLKRARSWFLKARNLFPNHKGADTGLRRVRAAEVRARKRAAEARARKRAVEAKAAQKRKLWLAGFTSCVRGHGGLKTCTNSIGMKFVLIPAGSFMLGSRLSVGEVHRRYTQEKYPKFAVSVFQNEHPRHRVVISRPFYMQTTEMTQAQYRAIMGTNPSRFKGCDRCPVENVSWNDAQEFVRRLNAREKTNKYRLPTEAEWEYACRAGRITVFSYGDDRKRLGEYAWYWNNSGRKTHPVGQKKPNAWDLYDMPGNVLEWCSDRYGQDYYSNSPARDPQGPSSGSNRVLRGGSWGTNPIGLRSAQRFSLDSSYRDLATGFRVLRVY